ncbi:MAG: ISNCY family transposase [Candidatus Omnitrophota bacterium]|nr:ISNCY family transposase [Candidatus Omnitrophota bacterium]
MTGRDMIAMSQGDLRRLAVIHKVIDKRVTQVEAAGMLDLSDRQIRRLMTRVSEDGDKGIIHASRGQPSHNAKDLKIKKKAINLCRGTYEGFGPTLASEKLFERDKIEISRETLRRWLKDEKLPYRDRKKRPHRQWRERKHHYGQMVQMDGSHHDWFEGRGPWCVLMGYIDDATGIPFAKFCLYEGSLTAMSGFKGYIKKHGIPLSVYLDKHSTYKPTKKQTIEDELNNIDPLSQFGRALGELGVELIHANSPQAKGRIERLFETFQDRVIKEMRLRKISSIDEANKFLEYYLPVFAKRFGVPPAKEGDLHRPLPKGIDLTRILCVKTERSLNNDFTVAHEKKLYQILDNVRAKKVMVEEHIDGSMIIRYKDVSLKFKEITKRVKKEPQRKAYEFRLSTAHTPPADHPWKNFKFGAQYPHYSQREKVAPKEKGLLLTAQI